jgi:hypothetical protein
MRKERSVPTDTSGVLTKVLAAEPLGARVHDAVIGEGYAGTRWTNNARTGLTLHRIEDGLIVQSWSAARSAEAGPWPDAERGVDPEVVAGRTRQEEGDVRRVMDLYFDIRADQARADELRAMFAEPMVVLGSGPTRIESLDDFVERVLREPWDTPNIRFEPHEVVCSGERALLRWTYFDGDAVAAAGLTLYAFSGPTITERWQTSLPAGVGWL